MGKLSDGQKLEIVEKYSSGKYNYVSLGKEYGVTGGSIKSILTRRGISLNSDLSSFKRKYSLNEQYFDKIDNEHKAYWLGFLYADGYHNEKVFSFKISLQYKDREILEKFQKDLGSNRPLSIEKVSKRNPKWQDNIIININSKHMSQSLIKLGCRKNKSFTLPFPTKEQVPEHLLRHFIRGYFDGDGNFTLNKVKNHHNNNYKTMSLCICSSTIFCVELQKIIWDNFQINTYLRNITNSNGNTITTISTNGAIRVFTLLKWLYDDSTIKLDRKFTKFLDCKEKWEDKYPQL